MNPITKFRAYLMYREAVKKADKAHEERGSRYYVLPADDKLLILNRKDLQHLKRKHYTSRSVTTHDLLRECFYHTPHANGSGEISPTSLKARKIVFYNWYNELKKRKK